MTQLPFEMMALLALAVFAGALWIPYIIGVATAPEGSLPDDAPDGFMRIADPSLQRPWVQRAYRAHLNLLEQFLPFAVLVLILDRVGGFSAVTAATCAAFVALRLAHAVVYITAWWGFPLRPLLFTGGFVCLLILGSAVLMA